MIIPYGVNDPIAVPNNAMLAERVQRYQNVELGDWHAASIGRPEFVERDAIHLTLQGAQAYASLIATHLADP